MSPRRRVKKPKPEIGPVIRASALGFAPGDMVSQLLTERQRQQLSSVASILQLPRGTVLYEAEDRAGSVWIVEQGVVKSFRELANGKRQIMGFLFKGDVFGLAADGVYVNTTRAVTAVTVHRIAAHTLTEILMRDPQLEFQFLCKVVHELRELQRRAVVVGRRDATGRVAMFVNMLARANPPSATPKREIAIPMTRTDIAEYLNLTPEAISRAIAQLKRDRVLVFVNRHTVRIVDQDRFDQLVAAV